MQSLFRYLFVAMLCSAALEPSLRAVEPGFIPLFDRDHTDGWKHAGAGGFTIADGIATTYVGADRHPGAYWYMKQGFGDFALRLEFKADQPTSNSGVFLRCPSPDAPDGHAGYEVQIYGRAAKDQPTGSIYGYQPPTEVPLRGVGEWNEMEVTVVGQQYMVRLNGQIINKFTGSKGTSGYVGLQNHAGGSVQIRNVRIKDLSAAVPELATAGAPVATPGQPLLEAFSQLAPNASAWVLAPLDENVPVNVRQNLTYLREDMLDEYRQKPKASAAAYKLASQLCSAMIAALDERDQTLVRAGYNAAQADANINISGDQALSARRNYMMSWPQYRREQAQRMELKSEAVNHAQVMKERPKVDWSNRTDALRKILDDLYGQFREALRQSPVAK